MSSLLEQQERRTYNVAEAIKQQKTEGALSQVYLGKSIYIDLYWQELVIGGFGTKRADRVTDRPWRTCRRPGRTSCSWPINWKIQDRRGSWHDMELMIFVGEWDQVAVSFGLQMAGVEMQEAWASNGSAFRLKEDKEFLNNFAKWRVSDLVFPSRPRQAELSDATRLRSFRFWPQRETFGSNYHVSWPTVWLFLMLFIVICSFSPFGLRKLVQ